MAFSSAVILQGTTLFIATATATADADTGGTIAHGLGAAPLTWGYTEILQASAAVSAWAITADATNLTLTKGTGVGSGNAGAQIRVYAELPHSIVR